MQNPSTTLPQPPQTELRSDTTKNLGQPPNLTPSSTIGSKFAVAITGLGLSLFVLFHMLGNLQVFLGREHYNGYAHFLKSNPEILWPGRLGLLIFFVAHIILAVRLKQKNWSARSHGYAYARNYRAASPSSRTMIYSGLVLLLFTLYHLAHFTIYLTNPGYGQLEDPLSHHHDVYSMVIWGFRDPVVTGLYVLAMIFLGLHLWHGVGSTFQSLGLNSFKWRCCTEYLGYAWTLLVVVGNIAIPVLILLEYYAGLPVLPETPTPLP